MTLPYLWHLRAGSDLVTPHEATRAGFLVLALEKNRRATPHVAQARALQEAASQAKTPATLLQIPNIEIGLLTAAGLSDKALTHLQPKDKQKAVSGLIKNFLEPAGETFVEELVFRFLLIRGDALGGSMRNVGGVLAQRKLTRAILSSLAVAGILYQWQHTKTKTWITMTEDDTDIELSLRGIHWQTENGPRTLLYNLNVPLLKNNVDLCLFSLTPDEAHQSAYRVPESTLALGELKGGIDPAGADEHWKTARTALHRIREAFSAAGYSPYTFFIGAAIEKRMAGEIWSDLQSGTLTNAANLNVENQVASVSRWLTSL
ncbi:MAG: type II restriction endonuclease [Anaerolineae bacterium]|nr:type II restriction endonuclease [Anaerolineae bacterium]